MRELEKEKTLRRRGAAPRRICPSPPGQRSELPRARMGRANEQREGSGKQTGGSGAKDAEKGRGSRVPRRNLMLPNGTVRGRRLRLTPAVRYPG